MGFGKIREEEILIEEEEGGEEERGTWGEGGRP